MEDLRHGASYLSKNSEHQAPTLNGPSEERDGESVLSRDMYGRHKKYQDEMNQGPKIEYMSANVSIYFTGLQ